MLTDLGLERREEGRADCLVNPFFVQQSLQFEAGLGRHTVIRRQDNCSSRCLEASSESSLAGCSLMPALPVTELGLHSASVSFA